jgi:hypothetical protein
MAYKALTFIELGGTKFSPGDKIDESELTEIGGQTKESIQALVKDGVISEDMDAPVDTAHAAPETEPGVISTSDGGSGN